MKRVGLATFLATLAAFGATYMLLVFTSRWNEEAYTAAGILLAGAAIFSFIMAEVRGKKEFASNMWGILSGLFLWGFVGEYLEAIGWAEIAHHHFLPVLLLAGFFLVFLIMRRQLADRFAFAFGHFAGIWGLHMWMIYQFEHLSPTHWTTYPSAAIAGVGAIISFILMARAKKTTPKMACAVAGLLLGWTVLEYVWGWRVIPGPYSI
ncbi:MAG: hypothetical protein U9Q76_07875 [candidate division WOR-3 bacterium]|nr:hypothetical protein [candidate division WOR-3 bacterium]